jgi:hypothetical protein
MPTFRMLPPVAVAVQTMAVNGRSYSAAPGTVVDVPDADGQVLAAAGWTKVAFSGPTTSRPTTSAANGNYFLAARGLSFLDTTLNALIVFDGLTWRNPATGAAV